MRAVDGPVSSLFTPLPLVGNADLSALPGTVSPAMREWCPYAPDGACVAHGIPFDIRQVVLTAGAAVECMLTPAMARWLVFMHTSDQRPYLDEKGWPLTPPGGVSRLGELAATYVIRYVDGREVRLPIRRRFQVGIFRLPHGWGENCFEAVIHPKFAPWAAGQEQPCKEWGQSQTRVTTAIAAHWLNWLWAWENPYPETPIVGLRFEPGEGVMLISAVTAGEVSSNPLRWQQRRKALLTLPEGVPFDPILNEQGMLAQLQIDLGQVISAQPQSCYPHATWVEGPAAPSAAANRVLVEYSAHPEAQLYLPGQQSIPLAALAEQGENGLLRVVAPAHQRVRLRVLEKGGARTVPVRLHLHGADGEYLAPLDRNRRPNPLVFEDYGVEYVREAGYISTYIDGETEVDLPLGKVYAELSKGFEIRPLRTVLEITPETTEITLELEKVLHWRERGWVSADTHVHLLPPVAALRQAACEGVNVVNLLAIQCGEMMANVIDFDGRTTWGAREAGGDGEHLVRVGSENRHNILGHLSLLGYGERLITPISTGGPVEGALGEVTDCLMTEWAMRCRAQRGLVVIPHNQAPRSEPAVIMAGGYADAMEFFPQAPNGIDPCALVDWYRFLNCGYRTAAVAGTDKMGAYTAIGATRTYAWLGDRELTYDAWMEAVQQARTFATCGPLLEFTVDGHPLGSRLPLPAGGGRVEVCWEVARITTPMTRVELVANGEIIESQAIDPERAAGSWSVPLERSGWLALLIRGTHPGHPEVILAHCSPVMLPVGDTPFMAAADAVTILEQIEGVVAYLDTVATYRDERAYRRMRLRVTSIHRELHNRLHSEGHYHHHSPLDDHPEHHEE